jgi:TIR domain
VADPVGFWSYARLDDAHSDGQLSQLRVIVGKAIGLQYGGEVQLWQDVTAIPFGADWAETIERTIGRTSFFLPVITPRFLKSPYCLDEFVSFRRQMLALGRNDLIFPVHYVNVDNMLADDTVFGENLAALRRQQWIDFRPFIHADPRSLEVRKWAFTLAQGILETLQRPFPSTIQSPVLETPKPETSFEAVSSHDAVHVDVPVPSAVQPTVTETPRIEASSEGSPGNDAAAVHAGASVPFAIQLPAIETLTPEGRTENPSKPGSHEPKKGWRSLALGPLVGFAVVAVAIAAVVGLHWAR